MEYTSGSVEYQAYHMPDTCRLPRQQPHQKRFSSAQTTLFFPTQFLKIIPESIYETVKMTTSNIDLGLDKIKYDKEKKFTLFIPSESSSLASSPASTPIESRGEYPLHSERKHEHVSVADGVLPRKQPKDVYDTSLSWWRVAIRRKLVASVERESKVIAQMQVSIIISKKKQHTFSPFAGIPTPSLINLRKC